MDNCPICNGKLNKETHKKELPYKSKMLTIEMSGDYCKECEEGFFNDKEQALVTNRILLAKRKADDLLTPENIKRIRKKVKLTQVEAQEIFGGGVNAFSKYERAEITQPRSTDILLRLIDDKTLSIEQIKELKVG